MNRHLHRHREGLLSPLLRARRFAAAVPHLSGRVADLGCGIGRLAEHVAAEHYVGIDSDPTVLEHARMRFPDHTFITTTEADKMQAGSVDTVACLAVVEHLGEPSQLLEFAHRLLKPGGKLVLTTPHPALEFAHTLGARLRLFSVEAEDDHEELLGKAELLALLRDTGFEPAEYRRFMLGGNQLVVGVSRNDESLAGLQAE